MPRKPLLLSTLLLAALTLSAQDTPRPQTLTARIAGMQHIAGFVPLDYEAKSGKLFLEIPHPGTDLLWTDSLPYGTGSNDLGLDRGQTAPARVVRFERQGSKVLLTERNLGLGTSATEPAEVLATRQSFPESVLWGFKVEAENPDGSLLVDATDFFLRDVHHVSESLTATHQGSYKVDASRSAIALDSTKGFPRNTEVETILTFTTDDITRAHFVSDVTPDPHSLTIRERQSFVALPEPGFTPRRYDPRSGYFDLSHRDYNAPLGADLDQRFIERHRLIRKDPNCRTNCDPVEPITYYVDRGAPEPIRSALLEGARWWNDAFTAAGWHNAFRVDVLPADADPMDVRYNIIQWVHRYTRGWSYGATVTDPRTGEILKGNVTLGSLRGRQDYLIAEALLAPYTGPNAKGIADAARDPMLQMVLARIRQLSAHETGHTLGLAHNFAASTAGQGTSVMDYPHPYITLANGVPDLSHAYAVGIGPWDKVAINYGYRDFGRKEQPTAETASLNKILTDAQAAGLPYITDQDARPLGSANPKAHLWDNGADPVAELNRILEIRKAALARFGPSVIREGQPMATLQEALVPLYLLHRYQTEAAAKLIAGVNYEYNLRGDGQPNPTIIDPAIQQKALEAVLSTLKPDVLDLPENILAIMPPHPPGWQRTRESFASNAGAIFDPVAAAEASADLTLSLLCNPERATRLFELHMRITKTPGLRTVLEGISNTTAERPEGGHTTSSEIERAVEFRGLEAMLALSVEPNTASQARAIARSHIDDLLKKWTIEPMPTDSAEAIHRRALVDRVQQYLKDPQKFVPVKPQQAPPGMPIGTDDEM
ncbi:zinc-dependent metalloprotease [Terriglobus aquaticus]|uniref:Zinc-dependent metalloprotease n=1 Tax=Terriglobus aquaticus TaxID=940139 RepID=A0ABW9KNR4_9BACT|nr:zinc-dependent metalloprotease [Terriglobus aquaticus]